MANEPGQLAIELAIEIEKFAIEREKLKIERSRVHWTAISVFVPLLVAAGTILYGVVSAQQLAHQQFELEIMKAVVSAPSDSEVRDRAELFKELFPKALPRLTTELQERDDAFVVGRQKEFFNAISSQGMTPQKKLDLWIAVYPGDGWATRPHIRAATVPLPRRWLRSPP